MLEKYMYTFIWFHDVEKRTSNTNNKFITLCFPFLCYTCTCLEHTVCMYRRDLDVDEVMVDAAAEWKPVEKPPDAKEEDGKCHLMCGFIHVRTLYICM